MIDNSALQLELENKLMAFLLTHLATAHFFGAHDVKKRPPDNVDYIGVIAGLPDWSAAQGVAAEVRVTFQPVTNVAAPDSRSDKSVAHQQTLGTIFDLFDYPNADETRAALNAAVDSLGVDGFEYSPDESEDGQDAEKKALAPKLEFIFEVFPR